MSDRPPFDTHRWGFILLFTVVIIYGLVILSGMGACIWFMDSVVSGKFKCDADSRLVDLLAQLLAASLGYVAGRMPPPDQKPPRDRNKGETP
jgi:hypothetical protein